VVWIIHYAREVVWIIHYAREVVWIIHYGREVVWIIHYGRKTLDNPLCQRSVDLTMFGYIWKHTWSWKFPLVKVYEPYYGHMTVESVTVVM